MVRLRVLNGARAGFSHLTGRFPCTIGRAASDDLQLIEPGIWDGHLQLDLRVPDGFLLSRLGQGRATVNGVEFDQIRLRNGDLIELGAAKLQFWIGDIQPAGQRLRELLLWIGLSTLVLLEFGLIVWLL